MVIDTQITVGTIISIGTILIVVGAYWQRLKQTEKSQEQASKKFEALKMDINAGSTEGAGKVSFCANTLFENMSKPIRMNSIQFLIFKNMVWESKITGFCLILC